MSKFFHGKLKRKYAGETVSTREIIITPVWQQITDGTQDAKIDVLRGVMYLCDSLPQHDAIAKFQVITNCISIRSPQQTWVRSPWIGAGITVTI